MRASTRVGLLIGLLLATSTALCAQGKAGQRHAAPPRSDLALSAARPIATADKTTMASSSRAAIGQTPIIVTPGAVGGHQQATRAPCNDNCQDAYAFDLNACSPVTFYDDNTGATEDCPALSGGVYRDVWFKFTMHESLGPVVIKYCGTAPPFYNGYIVMDTACPCSGSFLFASTWDNVWCGDGNWSFYWYGLPAGTYYWPLLTDSAGGYAEGPYTVTFDAPWSCPPPPGCPANTMYGQTPNMPMVSAYTSAVGPNFEYTVYDNFWGVTGKIGGIHWWGLKAYFYYGWATCVDPTPLEFEVKFYQNGTTPGAVVNSYVVTPTVVDMGPYWAYSNLFYYSVDQLDPCVNLDAGWVSVKSLLNPGGCVFLWANSPTGDFSSYQQPGGGTLDQLDTDMAFCLTAGACPDIFGACCNDYNGECVYPVEWGQCMPPLRFTPDTDCDHITPLCGIRGACCDAGLVCQFTGFESECDAVSGRFFPGETCPAWVCPADCEHRIDLYDCYGDGWNGNTLDVLVNGVTVLSQITLASGTGPMSFYFMAATGDTIQTIYYPTGGWPYEPYYYVYDGFGTLIGLDGIVGTDCYVQPTAITCIGNCNAPTTGACCYYAGGCDMVSDPGQCIDGEFLGLGHQCFECPCYVPCPPEGIPEPEPCGEDTDGGCGMDPPTFAPLACGDTYCGTMWANTGLRDSDWYQLTLDVPQYLTWSAASQVPLLIFIIQGAGPNDCSSYSILASATAGECQPASITVEGSAGGTYWCWAGPSAWQNWPCDKDYTASLTCAPVPTGACCLPNGDCIEINPSGCAAQNGTYQGDYTLCADVVCTPFYCPGGAQICDEYIGEVEIGVVYNSSGCEAGQYADYTYLSADLIVGEPTPLIVTNGNPIWVADTCSVWIDWNHDFVFDDDTESLGDVPGVGPYVFNIIPSSSALPGPTRMRIRIDYANVNPQPCGTTQYGEVEDYTVNVHEAVGACCWPDGSCTIEPQSACGGYWGGTGSMCANTDCNNNGVDDYCEMGWCSDADRNGVLDVCDPDCDGNGIVDACEVPGGCYVGDCAWCHPYTCGAGLDCQGNGVLDACDIGNGTSQDCQGNGIPDECEVGGGPPHTYLYDDGTHENSIGLTAGGYVGWMVDFVVTGGAGNINKVDIAYGMVTDGSPVTIYLWSDPNSDGNPTDGQVLASANVVTANGDLDVFNEVAIGPANVGGDGTHFFPGAIIQHTAGQYPCSLDQTSSAGKSWICGGSTPLDPNNLGAAELPPLVIDTYFPGNWLVRAEAGGGADCNENGIPDECDVPPICQGPDCSQDCQPNLIPDECELVYNDCNGNGIPDDCDIASGSSLDCNANGIPDECDLADGTSQDCNGNAIPDECDIASETSQDCDGGGVPDECDIANCPPGEKWCCDCQGDGIPDICELFTDNDRDMLMWDDGTSENSLGGPPAICWIHHFSLTGSGTVVAIRTCFGTPLYPGSSGVTPGMSFEVFAWSDPDGDGNPVDAHLLGRQAASVDAGSIDTDVFQTVALSSGVFVGTSFFVGAAATNTGLYPGPMDENGIQHHESWVTFNGLPFDPTNVDANLYNMDDIGYPCNWLLRAEVTCCGPPNDCNENGIPDECDIGVQWGGNCATPGANCFPPECSSDWNHNGVPDSCELCGDLDNDGNVDLDDYWIFLDAFGACVGQPTYNAAADLDGDGCVTLLDYRAWRMCYLMANGNEFVAPRPKPMPRPAQRAPQPGADR